jgi:hypothetical protein
MTAVFGRRWNSREDTVAFCMKGAVRYVLGADGAEVPRE